MNEKNERMNVKSTINPLLPDDSTGKEWQKHIIYTVTDISINKTSGIDIALSIQYKGKAPMEVNNVLYYVSYTIHDQNGKPVTFEKKPPILLVNKRGDIDEANDFDFTISSIKKDNVQMDNIHHEVNNTHIILNENDSITYSLHINPTINGANINSLDNAQLRFCFSLVPVNINKHEPLTNLCNTFEIGVNK